MIGFFFAFAFVLVLLTFSLRLLRRLGPTGTPGREMEVLQRLGVGPRQGIAVVRIGDRVMAVSVGDGGVRHIADFDEADRERWLAPPEPMVTSLPQLPAARQLKVMLRTALRASAIVLLALTAIGAVAALDPSVAVAQADAATVEQADRALGELAPQVDLRVGQPGEGLRISGTVGVVIMMGLLTLLPTLILMMTSFTRILVVLHFLRQALGTQSAPPAHLMAALALLLTGFVMAPTFSSVNQTALQPWMDGTMDQGQMLATAAGPFRDFMLAETRDSDIEAFLEMSSVQEVNSVDDIPLVVLMSAFVTSELRTAFQIGFAIFLPFIVIDVVVASVLMSMGMFMLPPPMIALPFKILLFVLVDGWTLIVQGLVSSFQ